MDKKLNPERVVTTAFDKSAKRMDCRYIKGKFYKMNEEVFKFDGRWYRINSGFLVEDIASGKWILKDADNVICGLIKNKEGTVKTGYFVKDLYINIPVSVEDIPEYLKKDIHITGKTAYAYNIGVASNLGLAENYSSGIFTSKAKASKKIAIHGTYGFTVDYSFENSGNPIKQAYKKYIAGITGKAKNHKLLKNLSFGWEFETTDGYIHPRHLMKTSLIPLRDGSISGYEFATCPLKGQKGIDTTIEAGKVLSKYTTTNISCSLHLHIGNVPTTEKFLTDFYKICTVLEDEIYAMFPAAMAQTSKYKDRDYCNKLTPLTNTFSGITAKRIINWASGKEDFYGGRFRGLGAENHPDDQGNTRKWAINQRYKWVNVLPLIFSRRGTVEFRIHTPTTNPTKLVNWLYICAGIVTFADKYANNYTDLAMQKLNLKTILSIVYEDKEVVTYLNSYIDWRTKFMKKCDESGDGIGSTEIMNDLDFTFPYKGQLTLAGNG